MIGKNAFYFVTFTVHRRVERKLSANTEDWSSAANPEPGPPGVVSQSRPPRHTVVVVVVVVVVVIGGERVASSTAEFLSRPDSTQSTLLLNIYFIKLSTVINCCSKITGVTVVLVSIRFIY